MIKRKQSVDTEAHPDLLIAQESIYKPSNLSYSQPRKEAESSEYGAYDFELNGRSIKFRVAKTTPTKIGQFVTLWKRISNGPILPYDISDPIDFFVVCTRKGSYLGQFVFPKMILLDHDIISRNGKGGKRGIRVYPPWETPTSKQAQNTQSWQIKYFLEIPEKSSVDLARVKLLYLSVQ